MSKLIIAEKPSVAKSIASALGASSRADGFYEGSGLLVSWCVGHLVSPLDAGGYDERFKKWRYDDLPILPEPFRYVLAPDKEDAFENLRTLMDRPDVDTIVNACDAGREGELIFRLVYEMTGCRKPVLRLWISSMEDSAIREGFSDLRPGADYEALYQSALCRQKADWLVGINATRLFSVLYHRTLNVGRVQTPTLAMLAERDAKITLFHKEKYHLLRLTLDGTEAVSEKFTDPTEAEQAAVMCKGAAVTCTSVTKEQKKEQPPKLYDLTTLQREANRLFGYTAKQTLDYAQTLYEKKLLTYPRTDSRYPVSYTHLPKRGNLEPEPVGGGILSDPGGVGRFPLDLEAIGLQSGEEGREPVGADHLPGTAGVRSGSTEPGLGGMAHGLPERMDGRILWTAEPEGIPRMTERMDDRALRLKTLGNAVCPPQAYPIFRYIAMIENGTCGDFCPYGKEGDCL